MPDDEKDGQELAKLNTEHVRIERVTTLYAKGGHPFMIGTNHVAYASDHCSGILGEEAVRRYPCAMQGCHKPYDDPAHHGQRTAMVKATAGVTAEEWAGWVQVARPVVEGLKIDGLGLVPPTLDLLKQIGVAK